MSVDDRLREAFGGDRPQLGRACAETPGHRLARHRRVTRRTTRGRCRPGRRGRRRCGRVDRLPAGRRGARSRPPTRRTTRPAWPRSRTHSTARGPPVRSRRGRSARRARRRTPDGRRGDAGRELPPRRSRSSSTSPAGTHWFPSRQGEGQASDVELIEINGPRRTCGRATPRAARTCTPGWSRTAGCAWPSSRPPRPRAEACRARPGSGCCTTPRPSRPGREGRAGGSCAAVRGRLHPRVSPEDDARRRTPSRRALPSRRTLSSSGLPSPSSRPLNSTPVPSGNQAGSAA